MQRIHIIGRKNSGKTTLVVDLVRCLTGHGLRVGTIKHTHHHHELDVPGKDSFLHREAGAAPVAILSPGMTAVFQPVSSSDNLERYAAIEAAFADCDVILVEGDSQNAATRLEVWRAANDEPPYAASDSNIAALISDDEIDVSVPRWPRTPIDALADQITEIAKIS